AEQPAEEPEETPVVAVEPLFAARVPPPRPPAPLPSRRCAVFFDVENTSRAEHIARVLAHLELDWMQNATELVGVGNWRVIGHDTARLLASRGAHLVHSAPSVGVRDWSDLRIAVSAGAWLAAAHTAPHDELLAVARELIAASSERAVGIDALSNALKERGFRRTPGSPRLVTRLRRIKELDVNRQGTVRLLESAGDEPLSPEP